MITYNIQHNFKILIMNHTTLERNLSNVIQSKYILKSTLCILNS